MDVSPDLSFFRNTYHACNNLVANHKCADVNITALDVFLYDERLPKRAKRIKHRTCACLAFCKHDAFALCPFREFHDDGVTACFEKYFCFLRARQYVRAWHGDIMPLKFKMGEQLVVHAREGMRHNRYVAFPFQQGTDGTQEICIPE